MEMEEREAMVFFWIGHVPLRGGANPKKKGIPF